MTTLTLELSPDLYDRLRAEADRLGKPAEAVAREWLAERLASPAPAPSRPDLPAPAPPGERERAIAAVRAAGLLAEPSPYMLELAAQSTATLEEVQAALARAGGKPLSELILEMRGPNRNAMGRCGSCRDTARPNIGSSPLIVRS